MGGSEQTAETCAKPQGSAPSTWEKYLSKGPRSMSTSAGELYDTGMGLGPEEARQALNLPWAAVMNLFQQNRDLNPSLQVPEQESAFNFYLKASVSAAEWLRQGDVPAGLSLWWR